MHAKKHFWLVGILTGIFSGMIVFLAQLFLFYLSLDSFSITYILIYLLPLIPMFYAAGRLRERYGSGVLYFNQAYGLALLTGFISALVMSVMVYYVYTYLFVPALQQRAAQLQASLISNGQGLAFQMMKERKQLITKLLSPFSLSVYYFIAQLVLLPLYAFIIAIFARRRLRDITDI